MKPVNKIDIENAPIEEKEAFCEHVAREVENFISIKYSRFPETIQSTVFATLINGHFDNQAELDFIRDTAINLLTAFTNPKVREGIKEELLTNAANLCTRLICFAAISLDEKTCAEFDLLTVKYIGVKQMKVIVNLHNQYLIKNKLAIYEQELTKEKITIKYT